MQVSQGKKVGGGDHGGGSKGGLCGQKSNRQARKGARACRNSTRGDLRPLALWFRQQSPSAFENEAWIRNAPLSKDEAGRHEGRAGWATQVPRRCASVTGLRGRRWVKKASHCHRHRWVGAAVSERRARTEARTKCRLRHTGGNVWQADSKGRTRVSRWAKPRRQGRPRIPYPTRQRGGRAILTSSLPARCCLPHPILGLPWRDQRRPWSAVAAPSHTMHLESRSRTSPR